MVNEEPKICDTARYESCEVCKILGISRTTLARAVNSGFIKFGVRKFNNKKFFKGSDIKNFWRQSY